MYFVYQVPVYVNTTQLNLAWRESSAPSDYMFSVIIQHTLMVLWFIQLL